MSVCAPWPIVQQVLSENGLPSYIFKSIFYFNTTYSEGKPNIFYSILRYFLELQ
ncbi:hypothetical protein LEAN103870_13650 [Legionella anisa]|nr:hypothetical protein Lani_1821 [Legionella anisa]